MAVAFDAASTATGSSNPITWTHTPVGTPTSVGVAVETFSPITSMTYGSATLTRLPAATSATVGGSANNTEIWGSDGQTLPTGAQTITINFSAANYAEAGAVTVTGSDTVTCFSAGGNNSSSGGSTTISVTTASAVGELVLAIGGDSASAVPTITGSQTSRWTTANTSGVTQAGAASVTPTWSIPFNSWAASAASFKAAGGAAFMPKSNSILQAVKRASYW